MPLNTNNHIQRLEDALVYGVRHYPSRTAMTYTDESALLFPFLHYHPDTTPFVGLFLDRNIGQFIATLAVLTAGAAYVPIALDVNATNFDKIMQDTHIGVIITDSTQHSRLNNLLRQTDCSNVDVVDLPQFGFGDEEPPNGIDWHTTKSADVPEYVLFSSGTTGRPKGIVTPDSAVKAYCTGANLFYEASHADKWVRAAPYTFDSSIDELFCPLLIGASAIIQPGGALANFASYLQFLEEAGATTSAILQILMSRGTAGVCSCDLMSKGSNGLSLMSTNKLDLL